MLLRRIVMGLVATALLSGQAYAQRLWQNVNLGMSVEEVRAAQPAAVKTTKLYSLASGAMDELQIIDYRFGNVPFEVKFYFLSGKLTQVSLTAKPGAQHFDYETIVSLLRTEHGPETSGGRTAIGHEAKWLGVDGLNIRIFYLTELNRMLGIAYAAAPA